MQLQMTTDYALRILVHLATEKRVVSSTDLAKQLSIPAKYVLRVGNKLRVSGFADTVTGVQGGYALGKNPEDISLHDVVVAIEGDIKINRGLESERVGSQDTVPVCVVHEFFGNVQECLEAKLKSVTIATLLARKKENWQQEYGFETVTRRCEISCNSLFEIFSISPQKIYLESSKPKVDT